MTKVYYSAEGCYLHCQGHAGAGTEGTDIVCAGISALTLALLNVLIEESERDHISLEYKALPGELVIKAVPHTAYYGREIGNYFRVTLTGLRAIEQEHPEHITMEEV